MSAFPKVMFLTTVRDGDTLGKLRDYGTVIPLDLDPSLHRALDALDIALDRCPPTSLAKAKATWLPMAREFGYLLSRQVARAGVLAQWDRLPEQFSHIVLAAERIIPVDLIPCRDMLLGTECVVSHSVAVETQELSAVLLRSLKSERIPPTLHRPRLHARAGGDLTVRHGRRHCYPENQPLACDRTLLLPSSGSGCAQPCGR